MCWAISEKKPGGLRKYFFEPFPPPILPWKFHKIVLDPLKNFQDQNPRHLEIPNYFFFVTLGIPLRHPSVEFHFVFN